MLDFCDLAVLFDRPRALQNFIELFFVGHRKDFVVGDLAVMQLDSPSPNVRRPDRA